MERLTKRTENGVAVYATPTAESVQWERNRRNVLQRLAEYEETGLEPKEILNGVELANIAHSLNKLSDYQNAEKDGLLLKLPCKVGDTVWVVTTPFNVFINIDIDENAHNQVFESFVSSVVFYENGGEQYHISANITNYYIGEYFKACDFGKTVFLTREEAEQRLKELEEEHG